MPIDRDFAADRTAIPARRARWVEYDNGYKAMDTSFRALWYCWHCETPLSSTETNMDDVYVNRQDPALTVGLTIVAAPDQEALTDAEREARLQSLCAAGID
ncbi:hypothetical protein [Streptomyces sp. NPDC051677]|uniref:hypothetical protein n=1 Tax=Streptomyces sp. NPDC051677 TaxID=3365669 RepID=UPI0037D3CC98